MSTRVNDWREGGCSEMRRESEQEEVEGVCQIKGEGGDCL